MDRLNEHAWALPNAYQIPVRILANAGVKVEQPAISELKGFLDLQATVERMQATDPDMFGGISPELLQVAVSPDFHKGAGVPIGTTALTRGFVAPQAIGRDINCGMRMLVTEWTLEDIHRQLPKIKQRLRHVFFEGGRALPLDSIQKEALLRRGLTGVLDTADRRGDQDLWRYYRPDQQEADLRKVMDQGSLETDSVFEGLHNYLDHSHLSYDGQLGSIGGGNHFVELQVVRDIRDSETAYAWNLKPGTVVAMVHTGSVSVGIRPADISYLESKLRLWGEVTKNPSAEK